MVAVANFQYGWTLFVPPLQNRLGQDQAAIQGSFTVFVLLETWLMPFEGWLVDRGWVGAGTRPARHAPLARRVPAPASGN